MDEVIATDLGKRFSDPVTARWAHTLPSQVCAHRLGVNNSIYGNFEYFLRRRVSHERKLASSFGNCQGVKTSSTAACNASAECCGNAFRSARRA